VLIAATEKSGEKCEEAELFALVAIRQLRLRSAWLFDVGKAAAGLRQSKKHPPQAAALPADTQHREQVLLKYKNCCP